MFCWVEQSARTAAVDRFNLMSTFERVADTGSFTKAAVSLGISRATVSVAIQQLEDSLGVRLLHRTTRSVSLTPEGRLYLERARDVLSKLDATEQLFRNAQTRVSGRLCLDVPTRIGRRVQLTGPPRCSEKRTRASRSPRPSHACSSQIIAMLADIGTLGPTQRRGAKNVRCSLSS